MSLVQCIFHECNITCCSPFPTRGCDAIRRLYAVQSDALPESDPCCFDVDHVPLLPGREKQIHRCRLIWLCAFSEWLVRMLRVRHAVAFRFFVTGIIQVPCTRSTCFHLIEPRLLLRTPVNKRNGLIAKTKHLSLRHPQRTSCALAQDSQCKSIELFQGQICP